MNTYYIGDIHGKNHWKEVQAAWKPGDKVYILGDYFDSRTVDDTVIDIDEQIDNFYDLMDWAVDIGAHCVLGNHDVQYGWNGTNCKDKQSMENAARIRQAFMSYTDSFRPYYIDGNTIISHAGFTEGEMNDDVQDLDSCYWIRPEALLKNPKKGYNQVVGHTPTQLIDPNNSGTPIRIGPILFVDTVGVNTAVEKQYTTTSGKKVEKHTRSYDRSAIMKRAWVIRKEKQCTMSQAMKVAWIEAKEGK